MTINADLMSEARRLLNRARLIAEAPAGREPDLPPPEHAGDKQRKQRSHAHGGSAPPPGAFSFEVSTLQARFCSARTPRAPVA
jgi:hypothetical protein